MSGNLPRQTSSLWGWLAAAFFLILLLVGPLFEGIDNRWLNAAGLILAVTSPLFIFPPFYLLSKYGQVEPGKSYMQTTRVVDRGLFAILRHPQYLGYMLLSMGFTLRAVNWISVPFGGAAIALFYLQTVSEERTCLERFGTEYTIYCQRVPRFNFLLGIVRYLKRCKSNT